MNWNLFWGLFILTFSIACWICVYIFGLKKLRKVNRCNEHTIGKVIGCSSIYCAGIHIPLIEYTVNGKNYKIVGPNFLSGSVLTISTPFEKTNAKIETNLSTRENLPKKLKVKIHKNSSMSFYTSPLMELYPKDSSVDVYYNPQKPKDAFVQRFEGVSIWLMAMLTCFAVISTIAGLIILLGPPIVIK